jgi:glycosyltransferase involved in cell wall biosynthesis
MRQFRQSEVNPVGSLPPAVGVVIPTFNRSAILMRCLNHLESQTLKNFEVIVVDDGSSDDTKMRLAEYRERAPFPLLCLKQQNQGPSAARNLGISRVNASIALLLGDDTFPAHNLLETHCNFHRAHPERETVAIGWTTWSEEGQTITPLMRWLENEGVQFAYRSLFEGTPPDWRHFWTSNLSAKTAYLRDHPFNTSFPNACMEDIELGYRLSVEDGLKMHFLANAIAYHLHPTDFDQSCKRAFVCGKAFYKFGLIWPSQQLKRPQGLLKNAILDVFTEPRVVLPFFTAVARAVTAIRCPNPLLPRAIQFHLRLGHECARAAEESHVA